jgi:alcohol dehydrogenase class IV
MFGIGELSKLPQIVNEMSGAQSRVFLVTGRRSLRARGILQKVVESIGRTRVRVFDEVTPFPSPDLVDEATSVCRESLADIVVGIGGGSALDLAKCVAILMAHDGSAAEYATRAKGIERRGLPFIAVPTTSGSSSEVTSGAALWDMDAKRVMGISSPLMFPDVAIVDPELMMSMPKPLAAVTGMDAFTSAFESYWSTEAEPVADAIDLEVIRMFAANLDRSSIQGDLESRSICALAATMSGIAYSNSHPNACHAVGGPLTLFWGVEHGQAVGISLTSFLRWVAPAIPHKLPALWNALGVDDLDEAVARITRIMERCGLKTRLTGLGIGLDDLDTIVENIRRERTSFLPRPMSRDEMKSVLDELL